MSDIRGVMRLGRNSARESFGTRPKERQCGQATLAGNGKSTEKMKPENVDVNNDTSNS